MSTLNRAKELQDRTKKFAIRVIEAFSRLPRDEASRIIGRQLLRSGTSLAANYRASCRARSSADFISKIGVVTEEADETLMELLIEGSLVNDKLIQPLKTEREELVKIFSLSLTSARSNRARFGNR